MGGGGEGWGKGGGAECFLLFSVLLVNDPHFLAST